MIQVLRDNNIGTQPVTFPVRTIYMASSLDQMVYLLAESVDNMGTLTMWGTDNVTNIDGTRFVMDMIGRDRIYLDVPEWLKEQLS